MRPSVPAAVFGVDESVFAQLLKVTERLTIVTRPDGSTGAETSGP